MVFVLTWPAPPPFALASFAQGVEVGNLAYYLSQK